MAGSLNKPVATFCDYWGDWTVDAGYYGEWEPGPAWSVEGVGLKEDADELLSIAAHITAKMAEQESPPPPGLRAPALRYATDRHRLTATRIANGWKIAEYDYGLWEFDIETGVKSQ